MLRALGLGDLLTGLPALRGLRVAFPEHHLVLLAPTTYQPLLELAGPVVDEVVDVDFRGQVGALPPPAQIAEPDLAVNLHGRGPQSHAVLQELRPRRLVAFAQPGRGHVGPAWRATEHEVRRWCRLLDEEGIPADPRDLRLATPDVAPPAAAPGATLLHAGAASPSRRWPVERWIAVAGAERAAGRRVVLTGSRGERGSAEAIAAGAGLDDDAVLAGRTDLITLAAAVTAAGLVVSGDTGVAHLATALGSPSVVLFGPTPPSEWGPPAYARHVALWAGERGDPHADEPDPGLLGLSVARVLDAMAQVRAAAALEAAGDAAGR